MAHSYREAFLSLGSNLGDRLNYLLKAVQALRYAPTTSVLACSSIYETDPIGFKEQPLFLNAVIAIKTALCPEELLKYTQATEKAHNRQRLFVNAPRTLDIDLLVYEGVTSTASTLTLPHPRLFERAFVVTPLYEVLNFKPIKDEKKWTSLRLSLEGTGLATAISAWATPILKVGIKDA